MTKTILNSVYPIVGTDIKNFLQNLFNPIKINQVSPNTYKLTFENAVKVAKVSSRKSLFKANYLLTKDSGKAYISIVKAYELRKYTKPLK